MNIFNLFHSNLTTGSISLVKSNKEIITKSNSALFSAVDSLASSLRRIGINRNECVLIFANTQIETIEAILASLAIGATAVPVNPLLDKEALKSIIDNTHPKCCFFHDNLSPEVAGYLKSTCNTLISSRTNTDNDEKSLHTYSSLIQDECAYRKIEDLPEDAPAIIIFSSGSEGLPKGIIKTHGQLSTFFHFFNFNYSQFTDSPDSDECTSPIILSLPLHHLGGLGICLQGILMARPVYLTINFLPQLFLSLLTRLHCTLSMLTPSMYSALLKEPIISKFSFDKLKFCISMGEPCSIELTDAIELSFDALVVSTYGLTECMTGIGYTKFDLYSKKVKRGSCGKSIFGQQKLVPLNQQESSGNDCGELWINNPTVHACYLNKQDNINKLSTDWFKTGDLFERDSDGNFYYKGRCDDMFISNGKNIYPTEIERILLPNPDINDVYALPINDKRGKTVPGIIVVANPKTTEKSIIEYYSLHGTPHSIPKHVLLTDKIPVLPSGKKDRKKIQQLLQSSFDSD